MNIAGRVIAWHQEPPFLISEISCNHMGHEVLAHHLIDFAKSAGADAVKFQLYTPDDMARKDGPPLTDGPWAGRTLYDLYTEAMTPREWFPRLFQHARKVGLIPFTSVFNPADVDFLESLDCPAYKIASAEIGWLDLIRAFAATGKPMLVSTGMATKAEIADVVAAVPQLLMMHCVAAYPTPIEAANMRMLGWHTPQFGLSDHSPGWLVPVIATAGFGADVIEKHLMLDCTTPLDKGHSLTPAQFREMADQVRLTWRAMQAPTEDVERPSRQFKRRLIEGRWLRG